MRRTRWTRWLLAPALAPALCACSASDTTMATNDPAASADAPARASAVRYRQHPEPRQPYEVTLTLADAPGPFAGIDWRVQYDIVNQECLPPPSRISGAQTEPASTSPAIAFRKLSDTTYVATVYADLMVDEDIYGRGVCRWQLVGTRVRLRATGAPGETIFVPRFGEKDIRAGGSQTTYFRKELYPRIDMDDFKSFGQTDRSKMSTRLADSDLFTATFSAKALPHGR